MGERDGLRVLVCGGRDFNRAPELYYQLSKLHVERGIAVVISGGAKGADQMAHYWAGNNGIKSKQFFANWTAYGRGAGPIRNQQMLDEGKPDLVLAFPTTGPGTADMMRRARKACIEVIEER